MPGAMVSSAAIARRKRLRAVALAATLTFSCSALSQSMTAEPLVTPFSSYKPGPPQPPWHSVIITERKTPTRYELVDDKGTVVLHASADAAATGLGFPVNFDIRAAPIVSWRWKISRLIETADNTMPAREDSPARIVFEFDGDKSKLNVIERSSLAFAERISGHPVPYATLMYIWSNSEKPGTVIQNPRTARVQMVVASSGASGVGAWQQLSRNVYEDFRRAFGEDPGTLTGVGVLTDTDNTGEKVEAWYGDIAFRSAR